MDENYPPQGTATASVEINGKTLSYDVVLNATGRGTVTLDF